MRRKISGRSDAAEAAFRLSTHADLEEDYPFGGSFRGQLSRVKRGALEPTSRRPRLVT